jgi:cytochrome c553
MSMKAADVTTMKRSMLFTIALLGAAVVARADNAKVNWQMHCAMCHGKKGQANTPAGRMLGAPDLSQAKVQASFTDEQAFKAIKEGVEKDDRRRMKSFAGELTDTDIRELVNYLRTFKKGK